MGGSLERTPRLLGQGDTSTLWQVFWVVAVARESSHFSRWPWAHRLGVSLLMA